MYEEIRKFIYSVLPKLRSSPTMSAGKAAEPAKAEGRKLISFTVGDIFEKPKPDEIASWQEQLSQAADGASTDEEKARYTTDKNLLGYTGGLGTTGLRTAAAFKFSEETDIPVVADNIGVGSGAKGALNAMGSYFQPATYEQISETQTYKITRPADEVFVASPGWPTNFDVFTHGVKLVEVDTNGTGLITPEQLAVLFDKHPNAKGILINSPNNPTGAVYSGEDREKLMKVIKERAPKDFLVILDNPYGKIVYRDPAKGIMEDGKPVERSDTEKELFEQGKIAEIRSYAKEYGMAGLRVGYVVSKNADVIAQVGKWNENRGGLNVDQQNTAQAALLFGDKYIERNVADLKVKRDAIIAGLKKLKYADVETPPGAIYAWPDFSKLKGKTVPAELTLHPEKGEGFVIETPADAQQFLIQAANIVAVPGTPFYAPGSELAKDDWHFRMCFSGSLKDINKAMDDLAKAEQTMDKGFAQRTDPPGSEQGWSAGASGAGGG